MPQANKEKKGGVEKGEYKKDLMKLYEDNTLNCVPRGYMVPSPKHLKFLNTSLSQEGSIIYMGRIKVT